MAVNLVVLVVAAEDSSWEGQDGCGTKGDSLVVGSLPMIMYVRIMYHTDFIHTLSLFYRGLYSRVYVHRLALLGN